MEVYKLINPFKQVSNISSVVKLYPHQMNGDYYIHLKRNLEKKIVGKCNNDGMFTSVLKLTEYNENIINPENFTGDAEYFVKFTAMICVPIEGTSTVLKVDKILSQYDDFLISASNGYIKCALPVSSNKSTIHVDKGQIIFTSESKPLIKGEFIKVTISNKRVEANSNNIGIIGNVIGLANEDEIKLYYNDKYDLPEEETDLVSDIIHEDDIAEV